MEEFKLLSVRDLAIRWGKDERTIRGYITEGIIKKCKGVPGVMFHPTHIAELEGVELDKFSPLEKRRLERENKELKEMIRVRDEKLQKMAMLGTESMKLLQNFYSTSI